MSWYERARSVIAEEHAKMPSEISFDDRKKRIRDAYPFGERAYYPYKQWCKAQREYLARYAPMSQSVGPLFERSTACMPTKAGEKA